MKESIITEILKIENRFLPIKNVLENSSNDKYISLYRGLITIQSKIIYQPEILFLGINPGDGAFKEINNKKSKEIIYPNRIIENHHSLELDWLKKGNARGEWKDKKWVGYEWFAREKKINNSFPALMIDLLFQLAEKYVDSDIKPNSDLFYARFKENLLDKIVYSNLCPIATKSTKELDKIFSLLTQENELKQIWTSENRKTIRQHDVKNFFRQRTIDLIKTLDPKIIVCLGNSAFQRLTNSKIDNKRKVNLTFKRLRLNDQFQYPFLTISRAGNWKGNLKDAAKQIINTIPNISKKQIPVGESDNSFDTEINLYVSKKLS